MERGNNEKILFIIHYFYPDIASTAQLMTELCSALQDKFEIEVIAAIPSYSGRPSYGKLDTSYGRVKVYRVFVPPFNKRSKLSRVFNLIFYFLMLFWQ